MAIQDGILDGNVTSYLLLDIVRVNASGCNYGWPKWTKSAKGSTYEKFHVRKHTRIKSSVKESIRV